MNRNLFFSLRMNRKFSALGMQGEQESFLPERRERKVIPGKGNSKVNTQRWK